MRIVVGIPVRMGSTRFPGKPLKQILDKKLVEHVVHRCMLSTLADEVFVAACDDVIQQIVSATGARVVMTDPNIPRPALRVAEAAKTLDLAADDIVVVVQGDEPLVRPEMIDRSIEALIADDSIMCTCMMSEASEDEWNDINEVKVLANLAGKAMFMTRSAVPSNTRGRIGPRMKQLCIFAFRMGELQRFLDLPMAPHERAESIELLRALEHGEAIQMLLNTDPVKSVDTEADRLEVEALMAQDDLYPLYSGSAS